MDINIISEYDECETIDLLFTFEFEKCRYVVFRDGRDFSCRRITWNPWRGFRMMSSEVDEDVCAFAKLVLRRAANNREFYAMKGEHYITFTDDDSGKVHIRKIRRGFLINPVLKAAPAGIQWLFSVLIGLLYIQIYIRTGGMRWVCYLFPDAEQKALTAWMYIIELVGVTFLFTDQRDNRSIWKFCFNAIVPLNVVTLIAAMKSEKFIRILIIAVSGVAVVFYILPKVIRAFGEKSAYGRREDLKDACSGIYFSLLSCIIVGIIAVNFSGVTGNISVSTPIRIADSAKVYESYEKALKNINENVWPALSTEERIDTLQAICDYECINTLGCEIVSVQAGYFEDECVLGKYGHGTKTITINSDYLQQGDVSNVVHTLLHEARHVWQYAIVEMYADIKPEISAEHRNLSVFRQMREFQFSFATYQTDDYDVYYNQPVEIDSRGWADEAIRKYDTYISADYQTAEIESEEESEISQY